jgi:hypothetical protein
MAIEVNFLRETTIYVSTRSKLNVEQTQTIANELLRIMGHSNNYAGFKFKFIDEGNLIQAHASVDNELKISIIN